MEQSGAATPLEPIIVLGKQNNYLFVGSTVDHAVGNTRDYLSADSFGGHDPDSPPINNLSLDELEFFDLAGRPLRPVVVDGQLAGVTVKDPQEEIRDRMRKMFSVIEEKIGQEPNPDADKAMLSLPGAPISFQNLIQKLADLSLDVPVSEAEELSLDVPVSEDLMLSADFRVAVRRKCKWWNVISGTCGS